MSPLLLAAALATSFLSDGAAAKPAAPVTRVDISNGVTLLVQPDPQVETVAICCFVRGGASAEEGMQGLAALTARSVFGANDNQSREAVNRDIYLAGGSLETQADWDYTLFTCVTGPSAFRDAFYTIGQALKTAQFDRETVESARKTLIDEAASDAADPFQRAYALARGRLYSEGAYRSPAAGTPESLPRISAQSLAAYYRKRYTPSSTVISIAGNVTVEEARRSAENQLVDYDRPAPPPVRGSNGPLPGEPSSTVRHLSVKTEVVVAGFRGPGVADPDYPAWLVLNAIVGGGKSSRLFRSVRDVSGVGYTVGSRIATVAHDGNLMAVVEYDPARPGPDGKPLETAAVQKLVLDCVRSLKSTPPDEKEVARARRFAAGKYALAHERVRDRAFYTGWYETIGAGYALDEELPKRVRSVTPEDVRKLAEKYLKNEQIVVIEPDK